MNLVLKVESTSEVHVSQIASQFQNMTSDEQAVFLQEMFDALKFQCKTDFNYEKQLCFIATSIEKHKFKELAKSLRQLVEFIEDEM